MWQGRVIREPTQGSSRSLQKAATQRFCCPVERENGSVGANKQPKAQHNLESYTGSPTHMPLRSTSSQYQQRQALGCITPLDRAQIQRPAQHLHLHWDSTEGKIPKFSAGTGDMRHWQTSQGVDTNKHQSRCQGRGYPLSVPITLLATCKGGLLCTAEWDTHMKR